MNLHQTKTLFGLVNVSANYHHWILLVHHVLSSQYLWWCLWNVITECISTGSIIKPTHREILCNHWIIILNLSVQPINYEMHLQHIDFWTECCIYKPLCDLTTSSLYNLYISSTNFCLIIKWYFDIFDEYGLLLLLFETVVITPLISDHLHSSPGLAENCSHLNCCSIAIIITTHISQLWISCGTWGVIWAFKLNIVLVT